jgi:hypothetical protein
MLPNLMKKMKQNYVLSKLIHTTTSFDLWMFKGAHDIYNFVDFIGNLNM